jgi:hypothetical protein
VGLCLLFSEELGKGLQSGPLPFGQLRGPLAHLLNLHVAVADLAEPPGQPLELPADRLNPNGEHPFEQPDRGSEAADGHPHVVDLLGVLPQPRPRLVRQGLDELPAQDGERCLSYRHRVLDLGAPQIGGRRGSQAGGQQAGLELRTRGGREPAFGLELLYERLEL